MNEYEIDMFLQCDYNDLDQVMASHANLGAYDTEPRWVRDSYIRKAVAGEELSFEELPATPEAWQLYSSKTDLERQILEDAARDLQHSLFFLVQKIAKRPYASVVKWAKYHEYLD